MNFNLVTQAYGWGAVLVGVSLWMLVSSAWGAESSPRPAPCKTRLYFSECFFGQVMHDSFAGRPLEDWAREHGQRTTTPPPAAPESPGAATSKGQQP